ncbi:PQQ-dependent sugar dehydrogenase [Pyxidicoccus parkwayensis]|uniref:PQQ-dependent sugar dehydrogenase n=1 Tax=Pyxidicoccus parkwayensis TaxID=2813578 RepID=UPI001F50A4EF|nr:sorbosone dehydrogenase family protein [Pyxidicoccus parkwaysis]
MFLHATLPALLLTALAQTPGPVSPSMQPRTELLKPASIEVKLDSLPKPFATQSASKSPDVIPVPADATLRVPEGFSVNLYAADLDQPRWMTLTPEGDVLVVESRNNRIHRLRDADGDGIAETRERFADAANGLNLPFGMAFSKTHFFVGNTNGVRRYPYQRGQRQLTGKGEEVTKLPGLGYNQHWTRNVRVAPDGKRLFVTVGSETNVDAEKSPRASVLVMGLDGSERQTFASGLRNPVGLDFHPRTGEPYVTVNERDGLGDDLVPDYFTRLKQGAFYGWPYAYLSPKNLDPRRMKNGKSEAPELAAKTVTPDVLFASHSAALGLTFYRGNAFPERYRTGAFVAFRGSWNRSEGTGYKIVYVPFDAQNRPTGAYEDFLTGFLVDGKGPTTWGRPVGLLELPDGSLLVTDDSNGRIYRVRYGGAAPK